MTNRVLPSTPRWADDWRPEEKHFGVSVAVTVDPDGGASFGDLVRRSDDGRFDDSLESIVDEPMPGSPDLPRPGSESVTVLLTFGEAVEGGSTLRFAAEQTGVQIFGNSLRVERVDPRSARSGRVTIKYDVMESGSVDPRSIEVLRSSSPDFARSVQDGVLRARYTPATSNCITIRQSVVQTFGN